MVDPRTQTSIVELQGRLPHSDDVKKGLLGTEKQGRNGMTHPEVSGSLTQKGLKSPSQDTRLRTLHQMQ